MMESPPSDDYQALSKFSNEESPLARERRRQYWRAGDICLRILVVTSFITGLVMFSLRTLDYKTDSATNLFPLEPGQAIRDKGHVWTVSLNEFFLRPENLFWLHALMIFSSLLMDTIVVSLFAYFLFSRKAAMWRIPLEFTLFYGLRFGCLALFAMKMPQGFYWEYPGFYSLTVPYGWTNDFFFSGHIGACALCMLEFWPSKWRMESRSKCIMWGISLLSLFAQIFVMLVTRGHYTIDLIAGLVFAHYSHLVARIICG